jgi:hypothetical protein
VKRDFTHWIIGCAVTLGLEVFVPACGQNASPAASKQAEMDSLKKQITELKSQVATSKSSQGQAAATSLVGNVFYQKASGDPIILGGLRVYLVRPGEGEQLDLQSYFNLATSDMTWRSAFLDNGERFLRDFSGTLGRMERHLSAAKNQSTTDVDGKYSFDEVPNGKYHLCAFIDTTDVKGYWDVDLDLVGPMTLDLNNSNITKVYDRTRANW